MSASASTFGGAKFIDTRSLNLRILSACDLNLLLDIMGKSVRKWLHSYNTCNDM
jgi:hypothetical protein